jgi:hypothetical protein
VVAQGVDPKAEDGDLRRDDGGIEEAIGSRRDGVPSLVRRARIR